MDPIPLTVSGECDELDSYNFTSTPKRKKLATLLRQCNDLNSSAWSPICLDGNKEDSLASAWSTHDVSIIHSSSAWSLTPIRPEKVDSSLSSAWSPNHSDFQLGSDDLQQDTVVNCSEGDNSARESQERTMVSLCEQSIYSNSRTRP